MKNWLKRIRGVIGMGLTWAAAWGGVGPIIGSVVISGSTLSDAALLLFEFGVMGFLGGATFSVVLGIVEGRRRFDQMSLPRFAAWGALGGLLLSMFVFAAELGQTDLIILSVVLPLLGAGSAAGSLALARRADDRELLEHGADVADVWIDERRPDYVLDEPTGMVYVKADDKEIFALRFPE